MVPQLDITNTFWKFLRPRGINQGCFLMKILKYVFNFILCLKLLFFSLQSNLYDSTLMIFLSGWKTEKRIIKIIKLLSLFTFSVAVICNSLMMYML